MLRLARHLQTVLDAFPNRRILLQWDRAPWHRGPALRALLAAHPRLELMLFPVAAPDLNPQEHVWKAVGRAVSHNHTFSRLDNPAERFTNQLTSNTFESSFLDRYGYNSLRPVQCLTDFSIS
jgi:transposase